MTKVRFVPAEDVSGEIAAATAVKLTLVSSLGDLAAVFTAAGSPVLLSRSVTLTDEPVEVEVLSCEDARVFGDTSAYYEVEIQAGDRSNTYRMCLPNESADTADFLDLLTVSAVACNNVLRTRLLSDNERAALSAAANLSGSNPVATIADVDTASSTAAESAVQAHVGLDNPHPQYITDVETAPVQSVAGKIGDVILDKDDVGLGSVDNTADNDKPISSAVSEALSGKSDIGHGHVVADVTGLQNALDGKQASLVSGTSIKTINSTSLLGSGDIPISGTTNLSIAAATETSVTIASDTGTDVTLASATDTTAGLLSAAEHTKLAGVAPGATAAGATGDSFAVSHLAAFSHSAIATALQPSAIGVSIQPYSSNLADLASYTHSSFDPVGTAAAAVLAHSGGNHHIDWTADQDATNIHSGNIPDLSTTYAPAAKGVTNGDSHDHSGGDGGPIAYSSLSGVPSTFAPTSHTHPQSDTHSSPDTDSATTALHHTLGTGALQAAAGNHSHGDITSVLVVPVANIPAAGDQAAGTLYIGY